MHADVVGPMPVRTPHGCHYFLVILDDFTHTLDLHLLTTKDQALDAWESMQHRWETKFSWRVKEFQLDNGGEFVNSAFISALDAAGITHHLSVPYMHQQNSIAECVICTIEGQLLAMLHLAGLPQTYWGEAALTAAYLHNHTESHALPPGQTPYKMLHEMQAKLGPKSREVLFMGYPLGVKGYWVRDVTTSQFFNSCNVVFNESMSFPHLTGKAPILTPPDVVDEDEDDDGVPVPSPGATDDAPHPSSTTVNAPSSLTSCPSAPVAPPAMSSPSPAGPLHRSTQSRVLMEAG